MNLRKVALAAAVTIAAVTSSSAQDLAPARGHTIDLGAVNGVAYYTVENGGFHVVATLRQQEGQPVRLETVLVPGQTVILSTTTEAGHVPARVEISRGADDIRVQTVAVTN